MMSTLAVVVTPEVGINPVDSKVTYYFAQNASMASYTVDPICFNVTGGEWDGNYCNVSGAPINISLNTTPRVYPYDNANGTFPEVGDTVELGAIVIDNTNISNCSLYVNYNNPEIYAANLISQNLTEQESPANYSFDYTVLDQGSIVYYYLLCYDTYNNSNSNIDPLSNTYYTNISSFSSEGFGVFGDPEDAVDGKWNTKVTGSGATEENHFYFNYDVDSAIINDNTVDWVAKFADYLNAGVNYTFNVSPSCVMDTVSILFNRTAFNNYEVSCNNGSAYELIGSGSVSGSTSIAFYEQSLIYETNLISNNTNYNFTIKDLTVPTITVESKTNFETDNTTIITNSSLIYNFTYYDINLDELNIDITCDIDGQIHSVNQVAGSDTVSLNATIDLSSYEPQTCTIYTNASDTGTGFTEQLWSFYIGGYLDVDSINLFDNSTITNYNITLIAGTAPNFGTKTYTITGATDRLENLTRGTYQVIYSDLDILFLNDTDTINVSTALTNSTYISSQAILLLSVQNIGQDVPLALWDSSVTNGTYQINISADNTTYTVTYYLNAGNYTVEVIKGSPYGDALANFNIDLLETKELTLNMTYVSNLFLYNEKTLEPFNISSADSIKFLLTCPGRTEQTIINTTNPTVNISCNYLNYRFILTYGEITYYRTYLTPITEIEDIFNQSIYLINVDTTNFVFSNFIVDDLLKEYTNTSVWISKIIGNETVQITADRTDIENKIGAYLIENDEYIITVKSDNNPDLILGTYFANVGEDKTLQLYDVTIASDPTGVFNEVTQTVAIYNISNQTYITGTYNDTGSNTYNVTFNIWENSTDTTPVFTQTVSANALNVQINASPYADKYIIAGFVAETVEGTKSNTRILQIVENFVLPIKDYYTPTAINWFILLVLGVFALYATVQTANPTSLIMIGLAGILIYFDLFGLSVSILGLSIVVSLVSMLKDGDIKIK